MDTINQITSADISTARNLHPQKKFHVFAHAGDHNTFTGNTLYRVEVRRDDTYSPVCVGDYQFLQEIYYSRCDADNAVARIKLLLN